MSAFNPFLKCFIASPYISLNVNIQILSCNGNIFFHQRTMNRSDEPLYPGLTMFGRGDCRRSPHSSASIDTGTGRPDGKRSERTGEPARFDPQTISRWRRRGKKEGERSEDGIPSIGKSPNHEQSGMQCEGCNRGNGGDTENRSCFFQGRNQRRHPPPLRHSQLD